MNEGSSVSKDGLDSMGLNICERYADSGNSEKTILAEKYWKSNFAMRRCRVVVIVN